MSTQQSSYFVDLLSRWLNQIPVPASFTAIAKDRDQVVIITQTKSSIVKALLKSFARRAGINDVRHASLIDLEKPLEQHESALTWAAFSEQELIEKVARSGKGFRFSTFNMFETRGPAKSTPIFRGNYTQAFLTLLRSPYTLYVFGEPIAAPGEGSPQHWSVSRLLKLDFYRNFKLVRGTPFQPIGTQEDIVLNNAEALAELDIIARREGISLRTAKRKARSAFYTMAANPLAPLYGVAAKLVNFFLNQVFSEITIHGVDRLARAVKKKTVVLVPMHRSHFDYLILGSTLYQAKLNPPLVAAGINLSFWPFGFLIRSLGGYFVKRDAKTDRINSLVLKRYVSYLVKRGHLQEFYIEGGRSRNGRMRPPKTGLLGIMAESVLKGIRKDILFVPVSITYETVVEERSLADENTGRSKPKENLGSLIKARQLFRRKYGEVIVNLGEPISLSEQHAETKDLADAPSRREFINEFARDLTCQIRTLSNPSLTALTFTALMLAPRYSLKRSDLCKRVQTLARMCEVMRRVNPQHGEFTASLSQFLAGQESLIDELGRGGVITIIGTGADPIFHIPGSRRYTADFYKNSTFHVFFPFALLAVLELTGSKLDSSELDTWYRIFANDFLLPPLNQQKIELARLAEELRVLGAIQDKAGQLNFDQDHEMFIPVLLLSTIQSLVWAGKALSSMPSQSVTELLETPKKAIQYLQSSFKTSDTLGAILRTEAATYSSLSTALDAIQARGVSDAAAGSFALSENMAQDLKLLEKTNLQIQQWITRS